MTINRTKILIKVKALLAKTIENGCTEAEAMSALNMAQAMMDAYEISEDEVIEAKSEEAVQQSSQWKTDPHSIKRRLSVEISLFTGCRVWRERKTTKLNFIGLQSDVDFAIWLLDTLGFFVFQELAKHLIRNRDTIGDNRQYHIEGFVSGCCVRINARLRELRIASEKKATANRNALMVVKSDLIKKKMELDGLRLKKGPNIKLGGDVNSFKAGVAAGNKASFGRPVGTAATGGMLRLK